VATGRFAFSHAMHERIGSLPLISLPLPLLLAPLPERVPARRRRARRCTAARIDAPSPCPRIPRVRVDANRIELSGSQVIGRRAAIVRSRLSPKSGAGRAKRTAVKDSTCHYAINRVRESTASRWQVISQVTLLTLITPHNERDRMYISCFLESNGTTVGVKKVVTRNGRVGERRRRRSA